MTTGSYFWELVIAGSGGLVLVIGLFMELEKDEFKKISQYRCSKTRKRWGQWLVIGGVVIEIGAALLAASKEFQIEQLIKYRSISDDQIEIFSNSLKGYERQPVCV